jgi:predicted ATPase
MAERLVIRNFGPVQEADVEIKDLTVFVGPQATGKSITAQLLYFMRGIEDLLGRSVKPYPHQQERTYQTRGVCFK